MSYHTKKIIVLIISLVLCTDSCTAQQDKSNQQYPLNQSLALAWKIPIYAHTSMASLMPLTIYKNSIICDAIFESESQPSLMMFNIQDGKTEWSWNKLKHSLFVQNKFCLYDSILLVTNWGYMYGLNLNSGKSIWETSISFNNGATNIGTKFFLTADDALLRMGDMNTGKIDTLMDIRNIKEYSKSTPIDEYLGRNICTSLITPNKDTLLIVPYSLRYQYQIESRYFVYNVTKRKILYSQTITPMSKNNGVYRVHVFEGKVYFAMASNVVCHDLQSGKQLWKTESLGWVADASYTFIADNKIIGHADGSQAKTFAIDLITGKIAWQEKDAGTMMGEFLYMNKTIYYVSSGDGLLHILDATTGKHLYKLECPGEKANSNDYFRLDVVGIDGKVFVRSGLHLYCYKAVQ
jgi:outer membrane protein assembly factor BamB